MNWFKDVATFKNGESAEGGLHKVQQPDDRIQAFDKHLSVWSNP